MSHCQGERRFKKQFLGPAAVKPPPGAAHRRWRAAGSLMAPLAVNQVLAALAAPAAVTLRAVAAFSILSGAGGAAAAPLEKPPLCRRWRRFIASGAAGDFCFC